MAKKFVYKFEEGNAAHSTTQMVRRSLMRFSLRSTSM